MKMQSEFQIFGKRIRGKDEPLVKTSKESMTGGASSGIDGAAGRTMLLAGATATVSETFGGAGDAGGAGDEADKDDWDLLGADCGLTGRGGGGMKVGLGGA
jgi:hypothetical protein